MFWECQVCQVLLLGKEYSKKGLSRFKKERKKENLEKEN